MTTRGFGDVPDEAALKRQGSKSMVNSIADRWFTWILTNTFTLQFDRKTPETHVSSQPSLEGEYCRSATAAL